MKRRVARGRRAGTPDTRTTVLAAARERFAARGFGGTTIREIAAAAGVDPALVHHYFATKRGLFAATLSLPMDAQEQSRRALAADDRSGEALVTAFLKSWDGLGASSTLATLLRSASSDPETQTRLIDIIAQSVIGPAAATFDRARSFTKLRAALVAAQLVGLAWQRYVVQVEPLASASPSIIARTYGPSIAATLSGTDYRR